MPASKRFVTPFVLPVASFLAAILLGGCFLSLGLCATGDPVPFVDALFISTSAVCVTGLATVDVFTVFNRVGQSAVLFLVQLGGIGIVTYTTLILYMVSRRISLRDRLAVTHGLLYNPDFTLGRLLQRMILTIFCLEAVGAFLLWQCNPERIGVFEALFIAVSAFCNAGFAPWVDNLVQWRAHWGVNLTVMSLIIVGGLGFYVVNDIFMVLRDKFRRLTRPASRVHGFNQPGGVTPPRRLTYYSRVVIHTSFFLVFAGAGLIFCVEMLNSQWQGTGLSERVLFSLFESVTSRTAGFATVDLALFSDITLLITMLLMFIGGSPGSCAGGIKTTAFRILCGSLLSNLRGHSQVVVAGRAMDAQTRNRAVQLFAFSLLTIMAATMALLLTENGVRHHGAATIPFLDVCFEVISAFGTVGLSINLTPHLSSAGKLILCLVMFIGRLGPIWLLSTIQQFQTEPAYTYAEDSLPVG